MGVIGSLKRPLLGLVHKLHMFVWELRKDGEALSLHDSADRYGNMEAAYSAGRAKLPDFVTKPTPARIRSKSVPPPGSFAMGGPKGGMGAAK
jgi:hypothetical protein